LWIGANPLRGGVSFFSGKIDNVFVYNELLTDERIDQIRQGGASAIQNVQAVPVPGAIWLFWPALAGLGVMGRKKAT
ncbi:hypothetical protein, partial [uncultured Thiocystis sp.]|uniref:hypothetical protein n=1 Tax=uncultured Thiocystis sp. TaxID=1202134 RepID=UPI0025ECC50C